MAMVFNTEALVLQSCKVTLRKSDQQRCILIAVFVRARSGYRLVIGTTRLESGACNPYNLRVSQLQAALSRVDGPNVACSVLAGDLNLRQWEWDSAKVTWRGCGGGVGGGRRWGGHANDRIR